MNYIKRDLEDKIISVSNEYACLLLTGARQTGKTTMLRHLMSDDRNYVTLDDLNERNLARRDPALFLQLHETPVLIDEAQYAPELFPYIKIAIDEGAAPGSFWLTDSRLFPMMDLARESLAGRTAILYMTGMSQHEMYGSGTVSPFITDLSSLKARAVQGTPAGIREIYQRIWNGSMPGYVSGKYTDREVFYSSYLQTYIERDVGGAADISGKIQFPDFIRSAACRSGQMLNVHDIAMDVGISDDTAKRWLKILEKSGIIFFLRPYSDNLIKRTVKTPKLYFSDTGLAAYLTRYSSPEILQNGAMSGAILENYVVSEIMKSYQNSAKDCPLWYYRDKNSREIDLVMECDGKLCPVEIKRSVNPGSSAANSFRALDRGSLPRGNGAVICMRQELSAIDSGTFLVPVWMI